MNEILITVSGNRIFVSAPKKHHPTLREINAARFELHSGTWRFPAEPFVAEGIWDALKGSGVNADDEFYVLLSDAWMRRTMAEKKFCPVPQELDGEFRTRPWDHQYQAYRWLAHFKRGMLAMEMGTGKSKVAIDVMANYECRRMLIFCPKPGISTWVRQFEVHGPMGGIDVLPLYGGTSIVKRLEQEKEAYIHNRGFLVLIINYEAAWRSPIAGWFFKQHWDMLVLDESHRAKKPSGRASNYCYKLSRKTKRVALLTGTPMPHNPLDLFGQLRCVDPGLFGLAYTRFKSRYADMVSGLMMEVVSRYKDQDEFKERFDVASFHVRSDDVLDLPDKLFTIRSAPLPPKVMAQYQELEYELILEVDEGIITAANAMVKTMRLRQFTSGFGKTEAGNEVSLHNVKLTLLADALEDMDEHEPVVIFCWFKYDIRAVKELCRKKKRKVAELSGAADEKADFQEGRADTLVAQIRCGQEAVDFTCARYAIYYSLAESLGSWQQSWHRLHRPGQEFMTKFIHLAIENTVDGKMLRSLAANKSLIDGILEAYRDRLGDSAEELQALRWTQEGEK